MSYHFSKTITGTIDQAKERVTKALQQEGFGVLNEINMSATLYNKLGVEFRPYIILGACNPQFAFKALSHEAHIGTMLPCNVILQQYEDGKVEISAIDPVASMQAVENEALSNIATEVQAKMQKVIENI
ncbi:MAG: DUF302 domain-containing protein [Saprospiraceae bacterium]|nr:MAG: hypothetical protein UZ09_BCD002001660 [Bacteroidetes bacterium OLB9]MCO6464002.1 DUF302 domain-containing protein [Saprospiraceae bacterium]MCZ2338045.1 DUF302 domain-containing protein [Chitinophagales bacterium]